MMPGTGRTATRAAALAACLSGLVSAPAAADNRKPGIVAGDNREIARDDPRLRAVGRLNKSGTGFCTATLIAPDLIVTAAHCLYYGHNGRPIPPDRLHFVAGWRKGEYLAHRRGRAAAPHPDYDPDGGDAERRLGADIAVVWLDRPIAERAIRPLPVDRREGRLRLAVPLTHVSYAEDRAHLPSIERGCVVREEAGPILLTDCDANYGGSGAPVLRETEDGFSVLGVMSGAVKLRGITRTAAVRVMRAKAAFQKGVR